MQSILNNSDNLVLEQELRRERDLFALAFHRGKRMSDLAELVNRIHDLEEKIAESGGNSNKD